MGDLERFVPVSNGTRIFARERGSGPPILLCDGLGCDGYIWNALLPDLAQDHRVIHWNYRGHGRSDPPSSHADLAVDVMVSDLIAILDAFEVERATVFGHSMGVQLVLQAALDHPERFCGLVLMCGSYGRPLDTFHHNDQLRYLFPSIFKLHQRFSTLTQRLWSAVNDNPIIWDIARHLEMDADKIARDTVRPYFEHLASMDLTVFLATLDQVRLHTVEPRLRELTAPTLVVAGEKDTFTPVWLSRRMARLIADSELLVLDSGSHVAPLEQPELVGIRVRRFLDRVEGPKGTRRASGN